MEKEKEKNIWFINNLTDFFSINIYKTNKFNNRKRNITNKKSHLNKRKKYGGNKTDFLNYVYLWGPKITLFFRMKKCNKTY